MVYVPSERVPDLVGVMLLKTGATSEAGAVPLVHLNRHDKRQLASLVRKGVIKETRGGRYWVDSEKLSDRARGRTKFALVVIVLFLVITIIFALYAK